MIPSNHQQPLSFACPNSMQASRRTLSTPLKPTGKQNNPSPTHHKHNVYRGKGKKLIWSAEEDELLEEVVRKKGVGQWQDISRLIPNRSGKQCRQRWHNHLREGVTKDAWSPEQFWKLALCVRALGRKWSLISNYLPKRSDNTIKNQWNCKMKPYREKFDEEIDKLVENPSLWSTYSHEEQRLLKLISGKHVEQQSKQQADQLVKEAMKEYSRILEEALKSFEDLQYDLYEGSNFELFNENSPSEIEGGELFWRDDENQFLL